MLKLHNPTQTGFSTLFDSSQNHLPNVHSPQKTASKCKTRSVMTRALRNKWLIILISFQSCQFFLLIFVIKQLPLSSKHLIQPSNPSKIIRKISHSVTTTVITHSFSIRHQIMSLNKKERSAKMSICLTFVANNCPWKGDWIKRHPTWEGWEFNSSFPSYPFFFASEIKKSNVLTGVE